MVTNFKATSPDWTKDNNKIIERIKDFSSKHPYLRFGQVLFAMNIIEQDENGKIIDIFYEESPRTLARIDKKLQQLKGDVN